MDVTTFLDRHHADLTPLERAMVLSAADDAKADGQDSRQKAERQAAAEERVERLTLANRQGHDPIGELRRARELCSAADDEVRDLADKLAKATVRRDRRQERIQSLSRQLDEITAAVSRVPATGIEGAASRAQEALREANAERRVERMLAAPSGPKAPRPFRAGGVAVRAEQAASCVYCDLKNVDPEASFLLHADPQFNVPVTTAEQATPEDLAFLAEDTGRSGRRPGAEITRLASADGMGQVGTLYGEAVR